MMTALSRLLYRILSRLRLLPYVNFELPTWCQNKRLVVPILRGLGRSNLFLDEMWMFRLLEIALAIRSGLFLDVGVNEGQTLIKLKALDPTRGYVGFEPNPTCVAYVEELVHRNGYSGIQIFPTALSDQSGFLQLHFFSDCLTDSSASIVPNFRGNTQTRTRLVSCCQFREAETALSSEPLAVVKIDVEGAEYGVLKSMEHRLASDRPLLLLEILPVYSAQDWPERLERQQKLEALLKLHHYLLFRVNKSGGSLAGLEEVEVIGVHGEIEWSDYLACPSELKSSLPGDLHSRV